MANPNPNTDNLIRNFSDWNHKAQGTSTIRVPNELKQQILDYAHALDSGNVPPALQSPNDLSAQLATILSKVEANAKGYQSRNAGQLIRDLRSIAS
jgi:hypothetical protein